MFRNIGPVDTMVRIIIGVALLALVFVGPQTRWGYLGLIPIATAIFGYCPLYRLLRISPRRDSSDGHTRPA